LARGFLGATLADLRRLHDGGAVAGLDAAGLRQRFLDRRDPAALEALVVRYGPLVLGVCRRLLDDPGDVDDAFQATFLVLVERAGDLSDWDRLGAWLHRVAWRTAQRARARGARRRIQEAPADPGRLEALGTTAGGAADRAILADELRALIDREIERLPVRDREVLVACDLEDRPLADVAHGLRCPLGTIKSRLARARARLRERLVRRGLDPRAEPPLPTCLALAPVSVARVDATIRSVIAFAAGKTITTTATAIATPAVTLARGVSLMMWTRIVLLRAGLACGLILLTATALTLAQQTPVVSGRLGPVPTSSAPAPDTDPKDELLRIENAWARAIVERDAEVLAPMIADDYRGTDEVGNVCDKPTYLADVGAGVYGAESIVLEGLEVRLYDDAAVVTGLVKSRKRSNEVVRTGAARFTKTYVRQRGRWRAVAYHDSPNGPNAVTTHQAPSQARPASPPSSDPSRTPLPGGP
jgi:RNA polymerase sigma factor (sigma-70 family)